MVCSGGETGRQEEGERQKDTKYKGERERKDTNKRAQDRIGNI